MLSRIAESLFWIGRYIERADGTARILDVYLQLLLEDVAVDEDTACRALLGVMGHDAPPERKLTRVDVVNTLATDRSQPASIAYSVNAARENARRAREIISTELWEVLNATYANMPRRVSPEQVHVMFGWVRERAALAGGMADSTASRDDAWSFLNLGRFIERADMVARLLATRALTEASGPSWTTILRSVGAYEAYLRTYRGVPSSTNAAEFLLLDRLFPRSILFSIRGAEDCLRDIEPRQDRVGFVDPAQRMLGQIRAELEFTPIQEIIERLPTVMDKVQSTTTSVSHAVRERYFPTHNLPAWTREAS
ncbi:alpha-E domain-containing protein [Agrococcus sp. TF02-05]|uniref:alpha-E domain-containing protein n=1 Tax=Agrococcus sp. TF02-05 TaxID=2815211 RepID=UPI001AA12138|nr:alpha-E domain-containing protein [Agrococcus sp. TF02-05]MBO1771127.1 alpha-E domain-containing protein [Agrococcus sp. TF02-05]